MPMISMARRLICALNWNVVLGLGLTGFIGLAGLSSPVAAQDQVGVFWDPAFTQTELQVNSFPTLVEGYLILQDPSAAAGIIGWELALTLDGLAEFVGWELAGQSINAAAPPSFVVGLAAPLLPSAGAIRLATFQVLVGTSTPASIAAHPLRTASVPGQMVFIPADRPDVFEPIVTAGGEPIVAWINRGNPWVVLDVQQIDFGDCALGLSVTRSFAVTNAGQVPLGLDLSLAAGCESFALTGAAGPVTVQPQAVLTVVLRFNPDQIGAHQCEVLLGEGLPRVALTGLGREPVSSYSVSGPLDFGVQPIGGSITLTAAFQNTGEAPLAVAPGLADCGLGFSIQSGGAPTTVIPGNVHLVIVRFQPESTEAVSCNLSYGPGLDQTPLQGSGRTPYTRFEVTGFLSFDNVLVGSQTDRIALVRNTGETTFLVEPALEDCGDDLSLPGGTTPISVAPNGQTQVVVRLVPTVADTFACELWLGDPVGRIAVGGVTRDPVVSWQAPTAVNFGTVLIGFYVDQTVTLRNTGEAPISITPALEDCGPGLEIRSGAEPGLLLPADWRQIIVRFTPETAGPFACSLALGGTIPAVALSGAGLETVPDWEITPEALVFAETPIGAARELTLRVANTGTATLNLDVGLTETDRGFTITDGGGSWPVVPGQYHSVVVRFAPVAPGPAATQLRLGGPLPAVPVSGSGEAIIASCLVVPAQLNFQTVIPGSESRTVTVINTGNQTLDLSPTSDSPLFQVETNPVSLAPGQRRQIQVRFVPQEVGVWHGVVSLGNPVCPPVPCTGQAWLPVVAGNDRIGIFFDHALTNEIQLAPFSPATGFLILYNASGSGGVEGWECRVELAGSPHYLGWNLPSNALSIGTLPDLVVGLASPLPVSSAVVLATCTFWLFTPEYSRFVMGPTFQPGIPGRMAWAAGGQLVPMTSYTGESVVATVNGDGLVGIDAPTPTLTATIGGLQLSWPAPVEPGVGCRVYRRAEQGLAEQLTRDLLSTTGASLQFSDEPAGFAPATRLYYSYSLVAGGAERVRSPEAMYMVPSRPAAQTRLLPNVPNPFNPETTIRFELGEPGLVRVAIYDVTGRQVAVLADEVLGAGPQARLWQGRDQSGRAVASGTYYVRLTSENLVDHLKILLLK